MREIELVEVSPGVFAKQQPARGKWKADLTVAVFSMLVGGTLSFIIDKLAGY